MEPVSALRTLAGGAPMRKSFGFWVWKDGPVALLYVPVERLYPNPFLRQLHTWVMAPINVWPKLHPCLNFLRHIVPTLLHQS